MDTLLGVYAVHVCSGVLCTIYNIVHIWVGVYVGDVIILFHRCNANTEFNLFSRTGLSSMGEWGFPSILDINPLSTIKTITDWPVFRPPFLWLD